MLSTPTLPVAPAAPAPARLRRPLPAVAVVAAAAAVAHLPFLAGHAAWLWQRPHYQFFPLILVGAAVLAWVRLRDLTAWRPGTRAVSAVGFAAAWVLLAGAEVLGSGWLGCAAGMVLLAALAHAAGGPAAARAALPAWVLLWLAVPPPFDLDRLLVIRLQDLTTGWSSGVLDALGVLHRRAGNVIEVDGRRVLVEQACSGINSLVSLLACTLFVVFLTRRGWAWGAALLAAAVGWVLVANVARVTGVVLADARWGVNLATGWRHEAFGLILFALAVGLLLSTDQLIGFLARPSVAGSRVTAPVPAPAGSPGRPLGWVAAPVAAGYLLLAAAHWTLADPAVEPGAPPVAAEPTADLLPAKVGGWERKDFAVKVREEGSYFGERSAAWAYARPRGPGAVASFDHPFPGWHDLTWCYTGTGWRVDEQAVKADSAVPGGFVEVRLSQPGGRHGFLVFCEFDGRGRPLAARPGGTDASTFRHQATVRRLGARLGLAPPADADPAPPTYQFQVFTEGYGRPGPADEVAVRELFSAGQAAVRGR